MGGHGWGEVRAFVQTQALVLGEILVMRRGQNAQAAKKMRLGALQVV